jgi:hypothetical protein
MPPGMKMVGTQDFLKKHNIGLCVPDGIAKFMQNKATIEERKPLMCIYGKYFQGQRWNYAHHRCQEITETVYQQVSCRQTQ